MKAIIQTKYGSPSLLKIAEIEKPSPKASQVLVRIKATAVNDYDWSMVRGKPWIYRLMFGLTRPKNPIPGMELSGVVEAIGENCSKFKAGDEVYGDTSENGFGTFAEYMCVDESSLTHKPKAMSFEEATAIPHAAMLAYQGLMDCAKIKDGQKILINGAGGGMGTFGVQLAKLYKVHATGVDAGNKLEMMKSLGFDEVIDFREQDFTKSDAKYDLILDAKTNRSPFAYARVLKKEGKYVTVGGSLWRMLQILLFKTWLKLSRGFSFQILALKANKDLEAFNHLYQGKKLKVVVDGPHSFEKIPELIQYFGEAKHKGKIVVTVG